MPQSGERPGEKPASDRTTVLKLWGMGRCFPRRHVASNTRWKNYSQKEDKQAHLTMAKKRMLLPSGSAPSNRSFRSLETLQVPRFLIKYVSMHERREWPAMRFRGAVYRDKTVVDVK